MAVRPGQINLQVTSRMKGLFFDRDLVVRSMDAATRNVLSHFGAKVRKEAIHSMPERVAGRSAPGQPPYSHVYARLRRVNRSRRKAGMAPFSPGFKGLKHIYFVYQPRTQSVLIGPITSRPRPLTVPEILEYGHAFEDHAVEARPFMQPAFAEAMEELDSMWTKARLR